MDFLRKIFPIAFGVQPKETGTLVKSILIHAIGSYVISFVLGFIGGLIGGPVSWLLTLVGTVVGIYGTGGVVLSILKFVNVIKD